MNANKTKAVLLLLNILMIALVVALLLNLQKTTNIKQQEINKLYVRKKDLLNQQQSLENIIYELNNTLQLQVNNNEVLKTQLLSISSSTSKTQKIIDELALLKEQQAQAAAKAPKKVVSQPVITPVVTTRAS